MTDDDTYLLGEEGEGLGWAVVAALLVAVIAATGIL